MSRWASGWVGEQSGRRVRGRNYGSQAQFFFFSHSASTGSRWACERVGERVGKKQAGGGAGWRLRTRVGEGVGG